MEKELLMHLLQKMDRAEDHLANIRESQARTEADIKHHIHRTDLLEEIVAMLKKQVDFLMTPVAMAGRILRFFRLIK